MTPRARNGRTSWRRLADLVRAAGASTSARGSGRGAVPAEHEALIWSERLSAATQLIASLEYLRNGRHRAWGGLNNWSVLRERDPRRHEALRRLYDAVGSERGTRALHTARILAAGVLLSPARGRWSRLLAGGVAAGASRLLHPRHQYGSDGSDQLSFLVQFSCALARAHQTDPHAVRTCLRWLAGQALLAYSVSGLAKLGGRPWREGGALAGVLRTRTYGNATVHAWCGRFPRLARAAEIGVISLECGFGAVFLRRGRQAPLVLVGAAAFHLVTAGIMGLGRFLWAFLATYPAVWSVARSAPRVPVGRSLPRHVRGRPRRVGPLEIGLATWFLLTLLCQLPHRSLDRLRALDRAGVWLPDWRFFAPEPARHDFRLAYRVVPPDGDASPWWSETGARRRVPAHLLWFPQRREDKALFDVCSELLEQRERSPERIPEFPAFRLLADRVCRSLLEEGRFTGDSISFQFRVDQCPGYGEGRRESRYLSPVIERRRPEVEQ
ncbi:hypothetical protein CDG81_22995 [Actinopolyspora erythraea]|uniref:HTTM domain-containing protein n=1 Tax=Actinopolyspora erythraea TaxID=414996 RepID=A0A223RXT1_9ACTN|nr:hypothetical protein [Actinopolyspora erythraea]ASU80657.1 hypothetical protein CDG81_22995 [Actinopolyspora erythraea]